jgi:hypothetical protein
MNRTALKDRPEGGVVNVTSVRLHSGMSVSCVHLHPNATDRDHDIWCLPDELLRKASFQTVLLMGALSVM